MRKSTNKAGFTKVDNVLLDVVFPTLSPAAQLILLKIVRQTVGWGEKAYLGDKISYSQFRKATGYSDNTAISKGLKELLKRELIIATGKGTETHSYRVNWETVGLYLQNDPGIEQDPVLQPEVAEESIEPEKQDDPPASVVDSQPHKDSLKNNIDSGNSEEDKEKDKKHEIIIQAINKKCSTQFMPTTYSHIQKFDELLTYPTQVILDSLETALGTKRNLKPPGLIGYMLAVAKGKADDEVDERELNKRIRDKAIERERVLNERHEANRKKYKQQ